MDFPDFPTFPDLPYLEGGVATTEFGDLLQELTVPTNMQTIPDSDAELMSLEGVQGDAPTNLPTIPDFPGNQGDGSIVLAECDNNNNTRNLDGDIISNAICEALNLNENLFGDVSTDIYD